MVTSGTRKATGGEAGAGFTPARGHRHLSAAAPEGPAPAPPRRGAARTWEPPAGCQSRGVTDRSSAAVQASGGGRGCHGAVECPGRARVPTADTWGHSRVAPSATWSWEDAPPGGVLCQARRGAWGFSRVSSGGGSGRRKGQSEAFVSGMGWWPPGRERTGDRLGASHGCTSLDFMVISLSFLQGEEGAPGPKVQTSFRVGPGRWPAPFPRGRRGVQPASVTWAL